MFPHVIKNPEHPLRPWAGAQPFGQREKPVPDVLGGTEYDALQPGSPCHEALPGEDVRIGHAIHAGSQLRLGLQHLQHSAFKERTIGEQGGKHHEGIVVGGSILGIPDIPAALFIGLNMCVPIKIFGDQSRFRVGVLQPSFHVT
jgi:hypothetical protein